MEITPRSSPRAKSAFLFCLTWLLVSSGSATAGLLLQRRKRQEAENALREIQEQIDLACEAADLGFWIWDIAHDDVWISDQCRRLHGFEPDEPLDIESLFDRLHPDDREANRAALQSSLAGRRAIDKEYRLVLPDNSLRWLKLNGRSTFADGVEPIRIVAVSRDITARRMAELQLQQHRNEIARLSRFTMLGEIAASLAHEVNQPLGAIVTNAGVALRFLDKGGLSEERARGILHDIVADGKRAGEVIRSIRTTVRREVASRQLVDLNALIEEVVALTHSNALLHDCSVTTALHARLPLVSADPAQLTQLFLNLIVNAFEACADLTKAQRRVIIDTQRDGDTMVEVCVRDLGRGLSVDQPDQVFEQFFSSKSEGFGLGLFIARAIATAHGGSLVAENATGGGARFRLRLPVAEAPP